ncbi:hypothetical protein JZ751_014536 [Albula glossodonta]|uniref:Uncharacterized protein n=1 Tax=Albula glossodonta TaxID=121402 RepID=A0A8T2N3M1_9TELE|nr:hypothetical protein JZ751_014536 [Albula glossodonta]
MASTAFHMAGSAQRGGRTMLVPCDTEYPAFVSERTIKETMGNIDCEGCVNYSSSKASSSYSSTLHNTANSHKEKTAIYTESPRH